MNHAPPHILRRLLAACAATLALLLAAVPLASGAEPAAGSESVGFGVAPLRFDVTTAAGRTTTHPITITNTDAAAIRYSFSKVDFQGDKDEPEATPVLLGGKLASDISGYDWLGLPDPVTIPAGESRTVDVRVTAPSGAKGGHYAAVIVSGGVRTADQVRAQSGMAVLFMLDAGGVPPPDIVITEIKQAGPTRTVTEYINNGSVATKPKGTITTVDPVTDRVVRRTQGECSTALPGGSGRCGFERKPGDTVGRSPSGLEKDYIEVGDPGAGRNERARGELPTEWAGTWTSMLLPLVGISLFVLYFLFLRRRRKDEEEAGGDGGLDGAPSFG